MEFDVGAAIMAGQVGGSVMGVLLYVGIGMMPGQMKMNLFLMPGTTMVEDKKMAYAAGAMMHGAMSIAFGLVHAALYVAFGLETDLVAWGLLFGLAHWAVTGMGLAMLPVMPPVIKRGGMAAPGAFVMDYPPMTAMGFLMLHVLFGVLVGATYGALV
jgi:hypothetical protein